MRPRRGPQAHFTLAAIGFSLALASPASAWEQARSDRGLPLKLASPSLAIPTGARLPRGVSPAAVADAFGAWFRPCSRLTIEQDSDERPSSIDIQVVPASSWKHPTTEAAFTTLDVDARGAIRGGRIELNGAFSPFAEGTASDLRAVLAHELGHVIGLGHSRDRGALMYAGRASGEPPRRALSADDEQALCRLYPALSHAEQAALLAQQAAKGREDALRTQWLAWLSLVGSAGLLWGWWSIGRA